MENYHEIGDGPRRELGCCGCMEKWFLWFVNSILFVVAIAEIGSGAYAMGSDSTTWTSDLSYFAIGMGVLIAFIAFLGCCGAARENRCMLWLYAFVLFWVILAQTSGLTVCAIGSSHSKKLLAKFWYNLVDVDIEKIEDEYSCCSFDGNSNYATPSDQRDYTSCIKVHPTWTQTCWEKLHSDVERSLKSISIAIAIGLAAQIILLFITMALITGITKSAAYRRISVAFRAPMV